MRFVIVVLVVVANSWLSVMPYWQETNWVRGLADISFETVLESILRPLQYLQFPVRLVATQILLTLMVLVGFFFPSILALQILVFSNVRSFLMRFRYGIQALIVAGGVSMMKMYLTFLNSGDYADVHQVALTSWANVHVAALMAAAVLSAVVCLFPRLVETRKKAR